MADAAHTENRSASATRAAWDAAYTIYQARKALYDADCGFGRLAIAQASYSLTETDLKNEYGSNWKSDPEATIVRVQVFEDLHEAENLNWQEFGSPLNDAEVALLRTSAPDLAAVDVKVRMMSIGSYSVDELGRPGAEIIADDVARLTGIAA